MNGTMITVPRIRLDLKRNKMFEKLKAWWKSLDTPPVRRSHDYQDSCPPMNEWADSCPVSDWDKH